MTLKDIAAMTGYSVSTVSRVLSGKAKGRSDKVQREIWEAAVKTNYVKNTGAASLRSKESTVQKGMIGVVFARGFESFDDEFYLQIEQSVHRVTLNHGYQIGETLILDDVLSQPELLSKYTGIVLIGKCAIYTLKRVIAACKNIVCTGLNPYFVEIDQVCCDGQDIAKAAVRHFILGGHKRIGYIGECSGDVRFLGYQQTMVEHDINFDTASIFDVPQTKEGGLQAAARFIQLTTRPTAIFCVNDVTAIGFLRGLRNAKAVRQPAIIGVGDIRASNYTIPTLSTLREQGRQKDEEIERLRQIILNLQRAQFGQRSEKRTYVFDDRNQQLSLFDTPEKSEEIPTPEPSPNPEKEIRVSGHSRKKKRTLEELCATLPVEERIVDLPDDEKVNANGHALFCIGQEYIRTELVLERAKAKVVKHYRKVYADRELEQETGYAEVFKPVMPPPLLAHSYASASVVTDVLMKKYVDAMPLYRQEQMWKRMGVELKRGTMANWVIQVADLYLRPFWKRIRSALLTQSAIHADETVMQVHKEKGRPDTSESRMWVYSSAKRADIQLRCFEYRESRSGKWAKAFLEGFKGVLITDGYGGYNKVEDAEHAGCWAHMRRKWLEAMPEGADATTCNAVQGYAFCNRLFELEQEFEKLSAEERLIQRKEKSAPVLEAYWTWLNTIPRPTGKLKDAVTYAQNQKARLCAFLEHGGIEISNNQVENAIRPFVVGRKGWLFADTPQGAEASAIIYSLMETAKANSLRLDDYLLHLLSVLPERAEKRKDFEVDDLLPWSEEMKSWFSAV